MVWVKKRLLNIRDISYGIFPSVIDQNIIQLSALCSVYVWCIKSGYAGLRYVANLGVGLQNQVFAGRNVSSRQKSLNIFWFSNCPLDRFEIVLSWSRYKNWPRIVLLQVVFPLTLHWSKLLTAEQSSSQRWWGKVGTFPSPGQSQITVALTRQKALGMGLSNDEIHSPVTNLAKCCTFHGALLIQSCPDVNA